MSTLTKKDPLIRVTIKDAKEILGEDFITPDQVVEVFEGQVPQALFPEYFKLPFTREFLIDAQQAGCVLAYQPFSSKRGEIDLNEFATICKGLICDKPKALLYGKQFDVENGIIIPNTWFVQSQHLAYFNQEKIQPNSFRLALKSMIPGTPNLKFMAQVMVACDWMEKTFPQSLTEVMKSAISQIRNDFKILEELQNTDSNNFLKKIVEYKFFSFFMETGLETLFRMIAYNQITGKVLLEYMFLRSRTMEYTTSSLGLAGYHDLSGPGLGKRPADFQLVNLGLGFSCVK